MYLRSAALDLASWPSPCWFFRRALVHEEGEDPMSRFFLLCKSNSFLARPLSLVFCPRPPSICVHQFIPTTTITITTPLDPTVVGATLSFRPSLPITSAA